jgi:AcrR family transcriptional regulator
MPPNAPPDGSANAPRAPRQERGQRRVEAILDATAALIAEEGVSGVTMHRVARRSGTTTGSMYHFFPDRETLLGALVERHAQAWRALTAQVEDEIARRSPLPTDELVGCLLDPFLAYSTQHPDLLPLTRLARTAAWGIDRDAELGRLVLRLARAVVASHEPGITPAEQATRAATMAAMMDGIASAVARTQRAPRQTPSAAALRQELRRALVAYLDSYAEPPASRAAGSARARAGRAAGRVTRAAG